MPEQMTDHDILISLNVKVDQFIAGQADHESRLRVLETEKEQLQGSIKTLKGLITGVGILSAVIAAVAAWIVIYK